jgi:hypothetical protein
VLFGYPIAATAENWLHECLVEMVQTIHANHDGRQVALAWPDIIPAAHRTNSTAARDCTNGWPNMLRLQAS